MKRLCSSRIIWLAMVSAILILNARFITGQAASDSSSDPYSWNNREPDPRYKADILVVVAHPDDETLVTSYLAREVLDHGKKVAVVYATRGDGGNNEVGPEQALAMGQIREIEARRALASLDISNVWFLTGRDTASQNVLNSLERWGHGSNLDQLVRIVRLTRPTVVLTFLPDFTTGENHADHQAAGVIATEAFDVAGDPAAFPEQISPVSNPAASMNLTEGLRPWQPEKIYYFHNPTYDIFKGRGPQYSSSEISPSRHESYKLLAAKALAYHRTQGGGRVEQAIQKQSLDSSKDEYVELATPPVKLIFGKSLVSSGITDDVFTGIEPGGIPFHRVSPSPEPQYSRPSLTIGDPWNFYRTFWRAHGLDHLANVVPLEITVKVGGGLMIPLIIHNPLDTSIDVKVSVQSPTGWEVQPVDAVSVAPHAKYFLRIRAAAPKTELDGWQKFAVAAQSSGSDLGTVQIQAELSTGWVAPQ
jgi:LmbE family N-acetylglucosaminyl deacetylase